MITLLVSFVLVFCAVLVLVVLAAVVWSSPPAPQDERPAVPAPQDAPAPRRAWWKRWIG